MSGWSKSGYSYDAFKPFNPCLMADNVIWLCRWGFGIIRSVFIGEIFVLKD